MTTLAEKALFKHHFAEKEIEEGLKILKGLEDATDRLEIILDSLEYGVNAPVEADINNRVKGLFKEQIQAEHIIELKETVCFIILAEIVPVVQVVSALTTSCIDLDKSEALRDFLLHWAGRLPAVFIVGVKHIFDSSSHGSMTLSNFLVLFKISSTDDTFASMTLGPLFEMIARSSNAVAVITTMEVAGILKLYLSGDNFDHVLYYLASNPDARAKIITTRASQIGWSWMAIFWQTFRACTVANWGADIACFGLMVYVCSWGTATQYFIAATVLKAFAAIIWSLDSFYLQSGWLFALQVAVLSASHALLTYGMTMPSWYIWLDVTSQAAALFFLLKMSKDTRTLQLQIFRRPLKIHPKNLAVVSYMLPYALPLLAHAALNIISIIVLAGEEKPI